MSPGPGIPCEKSRRSGGEEDERVKAERGREKKREEVSSKEEVESCKCRRSRSTYWTC